MSTWTNILDLVYPVGAVYTSKSATSPATLFGGTWTQLKEKFIFAAGTTYKVNATGGATTVTLTVAQMPKHYHNTNNRVQWFNTKGAGLVATNTSSSNLRVDAETVNSYSTGSGEAHNNMPPYQVFYIWYRTA